MILELLEDCKSGWPGTKEDCLVLEGDYGCSILKTCFLSWTLNSLKNMRTICFYLLVSANPIRLESNNAKACTLFTGNLPNLILIPYDTLSTPKIASVSSSILSLTKEWFCIITGWYSTFSMPACCSSFETSSLTAGEVMNVGLSKTWLIWWQSIVYRLTTCFDGDSLRALNGHCILVLGLSLLAKALNLLAELLCSNLATNYSRFVFCLLGDCSFASDKNSCLVIILSWLCFRIRCIIGSFLS